MSTMNTIIRCGFIYFVFVSLYEAEVVEDYRPPEPQNYQETTSAAVPEPVKPPVHKVNKAKLSEASNPEYDISKTQFRVYHHPRIHLQAPEVRFVYPPRRKPTFSYPRNNPYYGSSYPNAYPQHYPTYNAYEYDYFPRMQMISSPGVWMDQARHALYAPKVRVRRPPQYPVAPKVEENKVQEGQKSSTKVKDESTLNKSPPESQPYAEPYNSVGHQ